MQVLPFPFVGGGDQSLVLQSKALVKIVNGVPVGVKGDGAVRVPFEQQFPQIRIIPAELPQLLYALIVAKPTAAAHGRGVGGGEKILIPGNKSAQILLPSDLKQRKDDVGLFDVPCDPLGLVCGNA